ncbi:MAG: hemolysin family protein [Pseudomonadota bacterium]
MIDTSSAPQSDSVTPSRPSFWSRLKAVFAPEPAATPLSELASAIENSDQGPIGGISQARREMIERVVALETKRVRDVMAPRADIIGIDIATPTDALLKTFAKAGHSRLPVYRGDLDDPAGMVHIKDVVAELANPSPEVSDEPILKRIKRRVLYVPPSMCVTDLLLRMQASQIHMALVIDEFGGTDGLLTIEDLVEEIVGEINDEFDNAEAPMLIARPTGEWEADARMELHEFASEAGVDITLGPDEEDVDTLGGLVFTIAGRVPQRGEVLRHQCGLEFEVMEADARKIRKLLIRQRTDWTATQLAEAAE